MTYTTFSFLASRSQGNNSFLILYLRYTKFLQNNYVLIAYGALKVNVGHKNQRTFPFVLMIIDKIELNLDVEKWTWFDYKNCCCFVS